MEWKEGPTAVGAKALVGKKCNSGAKFMAYTGENEGSDKDIG